MALHSWIAGQLAPGRHVSLARPRGTIYVTTDQIRTDPRYVRSKLPAGRPRKPKMYIFDLSWNEYGILRDLLLFHVAESAALLASSGRSHVVVLLPELPARPSIFWEPLQELNAGGVLVLSSSGDQRTSGRAGELSPGSSKEYRRKQLELSGSAESMFRRKVLRRLGHFSLPVIEPPQCSRIHLDASLAIWELAYLIEQEVLARRAANAGGRVIAVHATTPWMVEAVLIARTALRRRQVRFLDLPVAPEDIRYETVGAAEVTLLTDVVNTGATISSVIGRLESIGIQLKGTPITAIASKERPHAPELRLREFLQADPRRVLRADCAQCRLQIPFDDRRSPVVAHLAISAYDMWEMLLSTTWVPEAFGPPGRTRLEHEPQLRHVFERYGSFIAYKLDLLLQSRLGLREEVVLVSPAEPTIEHLIEQLRPRFEGRLVAVGIPREVLTSERRHRVLRDDPAEAPEPEWSRQLRHLQRSDTSVILVDEYNLTNTTAEEMLRLMRERGVAVKAYVPILDRKPSEPVQGVPVLTLYELPHRPGATA
jgi:hypothetical protein